MIAGIHHVAVLTHDIEAAIKHYAAILGCDAKEPATVDKPGVHWRTVMLPICDGSTSLQLIEPHEGPGLKELERSGEGTLFEIGFRCDDVERFNEHLAAHSIQAADLTTKPLEAKFMTSSFGNRYFIVPPASSRGTRLEIVQMMQ